MSRQKEKKEKVIIFLPLEYLEAVREEAEKKGSTVSGLIRMIVMQHVDGQK